MDKDAFVAEVERRTGLSVADAEQVVDATLETLGERLSGDDRRFLADQLDDALAKRLFMRNVTRRFDLESFDNRVHARAEDLGFEDSVAGSRATGRVLSEILSEGDLRHLRSVLPMEYDLLFGTPTVARST